MGAVKRIEQMFNGSDIMKPHRRFIWQGKVWQISQDKDRSYEYFLFNDILICGKVTRFGQNYEFDHGFKINDSFFCHLIADGHNYGNEKNGKLFKIVSEGQSSVLYTETAQEAIKWTECIKECMQERARAHCVQSPKTMTVSVNCNVDNDKLRMMCHEWLDENKNNGINLRQFVDFFVSLVASPSAYEYVKLIDINNDGIMSEIECLQFFEQFFLFSSGHFVDDCVEYKVSEIKSYGLCAKPLICDCFADDSSVYFHKSQFKHLRRSDDISQKKSANGPKRKRVKLNAPPPPPPRRTIPPPPARPKKEDQINEVISYHDLKNKQFGNVNVDRTRLEDYLSDAEFFEVFQMQRNEFHCQKEWKQVQMKKHKGLF